MKRLLILFISVVIFFLIGYYGVGFYDKRYISVGVLSEKTDSDQKDFPPTPALILLPTETSIPPTLPPKPTKIPASTPIPLPTITSEEIQRLLERFSGQYGVDVNILRHLAVCESGFNPFAVNGPYAGLYQFNTTTWINNRILMGEETNPNLRHNAEESIQTAAYLISQGKRYLWPNCYP